MPYLHTKNKYKELARHNIKVDGNVWFGKDSRMTDKQEAALERTVEVLARIVLEIIESEKATETEKEQ